ncbi:PREDICTED: solute carrier organic anion transporter family member 2A1-like [Acromyrmex echinatior]|uniref:Solute carrier organic anion transporter family member n=1 Tax=Acromyrmex echinatior TaxID=103372 RepID=F4WH07_ACREC|nr:PREDICTED: solute carrier organic anion transporter family member 2A1-like [Acromyrmex echinatior]XP_011052729.1 PREDICTED: solute carrier organic anion transporter family member 2A1-like [Acromyrmex echinatior]XP_011052730.1 PREDICTED: solute carrier organic anion transporter family member 2A1-like [Acromyrmex echinatior]XP_011052731.1 PREDICTED: solute carrier organic anion transporter family member 2A1-like [Acromyrmex echinatior]EGI66486.1 Solute carrier organic anion transporter family 
MKNNSSNSNHEKNGPENLKLLQVPTTPPATPSSPTTPTRGLDDVFKELPITDDTSCGIWCLKGPTLQKFANKKAYVFLYGVLGCIFSASYAYFNGTITTIEKRFKIPSKTTGLITVGNDISQLFVSVALSYYAGRGHRPRWIAFGIYTVVLFCCLTMLPHFLYGPGEDALSLTKEYGAQSTLNTSTILEKHSRKFLCMGKENRGMDCEVEDGNFAPQVLLFIAQLVSGVGGSLYYTLGVSYMDDNIQKSKTPALISFSYFLRMLGPAIGYGLASFSLKFYISPTLTPTITMQDPRWLGAWWLGWIILAILLAIFASIIALFPKTLPRAAARKVLALERNKSAASIKEQESELPASISDMLRTFKRLITNTTLMCNNLATVFYFMGYMPYWIFMPKYIETQYKQSASVSSLITGTVGLVFSAFGILLSGLVISKYKPKARYLAAWNVMIGIISILGMISYAFLGCSANDNQIAIQPNGVLKTQLPCNEQCHCDYVEYNPVCSDNGQTFISACHAGCRSMKLYSNGSKVYTDCNCVKPKLARSLAHPFSNITSFPFFTEVPLETTEPTVETLGTAIPGSCPVDCMQKFYIFLTVVCFLKFSGATGRGSNLLHLGFGLMIMSLFAFIPSPILFGFILDNTCLVWGKTCSGTGNCWLYNGEALRYLLNFTAASFVTIGTVFDVGVWYFVKDVKIFDEEIELEDIAEEPGETL